MLGSTFVRRLLIHPVNFARLILFMLTLLAVGGEAATFGIGLFHNDLDQVHDRSETEVEHQVRPERISQDEDSDPPCHLMFGAVCGFARTLLAELAGNMRDLPGMHPRPTVRLHRLLGVSLT
ncbi:MAG: hypothetical protein CJBNEKGG_04219 [Prosthecobacter sp.]|nr:hypothetical protein [Prosthecobacter sp.]